MAVNERLDDCSDDYSRLSDQQIDQTISDIHWLLEMDDTLTAKERESLEFDVLCFRYEMRRRWRRRRNAVDPEQEGA
jgi:hypothetical protein